LARLDGVAQLLVVFDANQAEAADWLRSDIGAAGGQSATGRVDKLFAADELDTFLLSRAPQPAAPELNR
jgi:hypothetical protein